MKKLILAAFAVSAIALTSGCASTSPHGGLYTDIVLPGDVNPETNGLKSGTSTCLSWFGLIATGDASIEAAKKKAGITSVSHVDWKVVSEIPLGIKTVYTTTVYGK